MNERIRLLARQAKQLALAEMIKIHDKDQALKVYSDTYDIKFAELIVQECVDIAYEYDAPKMSGPGMIIAGRIQEHFGVEE